MPAVVPSNFNYVCALLGGFILVFGQLSYVIRDRLYVSEALPSLLFGMVFKTANLIRPSDYGSVTEITREFARLVLGLQLMIAGALLPMKYVRKEWLSIFMLLVPVMTTMWIVSGLIIYLCIPGLRFLDALIMAACVTPTDPVLSNSIIKGKFAEENLSDSLRSIISAESGANDGFGYPFLFLALYIYHDKGTQIARDWIVETVIYQIILSVVYGAVLGYAAMKILQFSVKRKWIDEESFFVFIFALGIFIIGTAGLLGTDDILACFVAGNFLNWDDWFQSETKNNNIQDFSTPEIPVWRYIVMGIAVMLFRRLPAVVLSYKFIPRIENVKEAVFSGFFGPIGVGAIFYLHVCLETMEAYGESETTKYVMKAISPVIYFLMVTSVVVHGLSIPIVEVCTFLIVRNGDHSLTTQCIVYPSVILESVRTECNVLEIRDEGSL
ncbi:Cation/H+ exchanger [Myxozyma melibiosi]|uniref:Cation/H+ exchanger n=1 Tax=Myxozyma melibiosi TaxID=54550 RepID=A0ABR1FE17_9ASCO